MDFRLLGPIDASVGPAHIKLGASKQRALLARLLLDAGRVVAVDRLVDDLWGEEAPDSAAKMVQIHVSHLRKVLPADVVHTRPPGYVAEVEPDDIDVMRFARLRAQGAAALAAGDPRTGTNLLTQALSLWRGPALAGLSEPFAQTERTHLEELRLQCFEDRIEGGLALGEHAALAAELEGVLVEHPLRERPRRQLMLALYRSGRHAEALEAYRSFRRMLDEDLGIDPSPALRELEGMILRHDPGLAWAPAANGGVSTQMPQPTTSPREKRSTTRGEVRYARNGDVSIAYQVVGSGDFDIVFVPGFVSHMELFWDEPSTARFFGRLASFSRLILHDKRDQGLSDRLGVPPTFQQSMDDLRAVMDAAGSERAVLFGISEGGPLSMMFAAAHPERTSALVAYGTWARLVAAPDYPIGLAPEFVERWQREILRDWGGALSLQVFAPSLVDDAPFRAWWSRLLRTGTSPRGAASLFEFHGTADVRAVLPRISVPTLVLHRGDDPLCPVEGGRELARQIAGARYVELAGADHLWMAGDQDELLDEVEEFLTGRRLEREPERVLQTVLFVDIVDSTQRAGELGDRRWRDLLTAYDSCVGRQLDRHHGRLVKRLGDGSLASFDAPARGIRCARAIREDVRELGLELRAGLHTGECEVRDGDLTGLAVHIGARVGAHASPGEVLVSGTLKELVTGSEIGFDERGEHELRGVPGTWRLYAVTT
jgi:DNA-binding SARP family transcriptional activator/class 3 adenylate cyclase